MEEEYSIKTTLELRPHLVNPQRYGSHTSVVTDTIGTPIRHWHFATKEGRDLLRKSFPSYIINEETKNGD